MNVDIIRSNQIANKQVILASFVKAKQSDHRHLSMQTHIRIKIACRDSAQRQGRGS